MTRSKRHARLSRRQILAGLGGAGLAAAGAGLGTTAYLTDIEAFEGNTITTGRLDQCLDWQQTVDRGNGTEYVGAYPDRYVNDPSNPAELLTNSPPVEGADGVQDPIRSRDYIANELAGTTYDDLDESDRATAEQTYRDQFANDPDVVTEGPVVDVEDVKPGDEGAVSVSVHLFDESGYVWLGGELTGDGEGAVTEPELDDPDEDDTGDGSSAGELLDVVEVTVWYDDGNAVLDSDESPPEQALVFEGTLRAFLDAIASGVPLDGDPTTPERDCFPLDRPGDEQVRYLGLRWRVDSSVDNEIQGDTASFDLTFAATQCRHNDGTTNPFAEV